MIEVLLRVYKAYCNDPEIPVPKTTGLRHQSNVVKNLETADLQHSHGVTEEKLEEREYKYISDTDSESSHEMTIQNETCSEEIQNETCCEHERIVAMNSPGTSYCSTEYKSESENGSEDL